MQALADAAHQAIRFFAISKRNLLSENINWLRKIIQKFYFLLLLL
jgi:hypothetical protein